MTGIIRGLFCIYYIGSVSFWKFVPVLFVLVLAFLPFFTPFFPGVVSFVRCGDSVTCDNSMPSYSAAKFSRYSILGGSSNGIINRLLMLGTYYEWKIFYCLWFGRCSPPLAHNLRFSLCMLSRFRTDKFPWFFRYSFSSIFQNYKNVLNIYSSI